MLFLFTQTLRLMKKSICILLFLVGFSAFALNPICKGNLQKATAKIDKKKTHRPSATPLADLVLFPHIGG